MDITGYGYRVPGMDITDDHSMMANSEDSDSRQAHSCGTCDLRELDDFTSVRPGDRAQCA
jgi:hypothetical protein